MRPCERCGRRPAVTVLRSTTDLVPGFVSVTRARLEIDDDGWVELTGPDGRTFSMCPECAGRGR